MNIFKVGDRVRIKPTWAEGGTEGIVIASPITVNQQNWVAVVWNGADDPDFHKQDGLEIVPDIRPFVIELRNRMAGLEFTSDEGSILIESIRARTRRK